MCVQLGTYLWTGGGSSGLLCVNGHPIGRQQGPDPCQKGTSTKGRRPSHHPWHHTRPDPRGWARPRDRFSAAAALDTPFAALSSMLQKSALPHTARHTTSHYTLLPAVHDSPFTSALKRSLQTLITSLTPLRPLSLGRTNSRGLSRRLVVSLHRSLRQPWHVQMSCGRSCNPMHL